MKKSLLQKITELLEAGDFSVSGIYAHRPDADGETPVTLWVREFGTDKNFQVCIAESFIELHTLHNEKACESAKDVYTAYEEYVRPYKPELKMNRWQFFRLIKKYEPRFELQQVRKPGDPKPELTFINLRLIKPEADGETPIVEGACHSCINPDCDTCPTSPSNSDPIKLYTEEEAIMALVAGKTLFDEHGRKAIYKPGEGFRLSHGEAPTSVMFIQDFSGLYSEEPHN